MASAMASTVISESAVARKLLKGIVCIYKPTGWGVKRIQKEFRNKISNDLNQMHQPPRTERVELRRIDAFKPSEKTLQNETVVMSIPDGNNSKIEVVKGLGYSDHPLITGPRYRPEDIKMVGTGPTYKEISGVHLFGVNKGVFTAHNIYHSKWLRTYLVSGQFGIATNTYFHTGRVLEKSTYSNIKRYLFERFLTTFQSTHQRLSFISAGVPLDSERAYELASQGLVRPSEPSASVIYALKLIEFDLPNFTIEVKAINEDVDYLKELVHRIGLKLHSVATCTKIRCTHVGPFGLEDALLFKHWDLEKVLQNMSQCREILDKFNLTTRDAWVQDTY